MAPAIGLMAGWMGDTGMVLSLEERIDRLESREAIAELCTRYTIACDTRDMGLLESCLTQDMRLRSRGGQIDASGRAAVMDSYRALFAVRGPGFHWTHDRIIDFQDADSATGIVFAHAESTPDGTATVTAFRYDDVYRREDGRWKLAARTIAFLYYLPVGDYAARFPTRERVMIGGTWRDADYPEGWPG